ncbi:uncharacterized protein LOC113361418 [Papaver somniferum]|uniref:uncharacterized protein LOC113361418 n=1 Tax=Papaver somniferum TaxID=3469 RepID=UPI000E6FB634|nr:uncharacterized protein LOC113361418 [Papaver somniferum]
MVVLRSSSKGLCGTSSSNSYSLRSKDVSDGSKRLCSRVGRIGPKAKAKPKEFEYTSKKPRERKYTSKDGDDVLTPLAIEAMRFYNKKNGTEYELVEPGCITSVLDLTCFFYHIDFIAKKADVADAPEEMFFC